MLVHGGMAQDVGPVLEMVTEKYLLRWKPSGRAVDAMEILDEIVGAFERRYPWVAASPHAELRRPPSGHHSLGLNLYTER